MDLSSSTENPPALQGSGLIRGQIGLLSGGVFAVALGVLLLEISLVRLFAVMLTYHYVFVVVSLSLFGLGLGGIFAHLWRRDMPGSGTTWTI